VTPVTAHELQVAEAPPSGAQLVPESPPLEPPLELLLELLLEALPLLEPLPPLLELLLLELLPPSLPTIVGPGEELSSLLHATNAIDPAVATRASPASFKNIGFAFITPPRNSQNGRLGLHPCTSSPRSRACTLCTCVR
jgi:hypothetical protein